MDNQPTLDDVWRAERPHMLGLAARMLRDPGAAEDVVQEAFGRLAQVDLAEIDDRRAWLTVVVRRLCLDRIRSAHSRRESVMTSISSGDRPPEKGADDPADRITLDDRVQLALAVVLDKLTPAERTSFVLHDVFGFPFAFVGEVVGRSPAACRQLARRARLAIRSESQPARTNVEADGHRLLAERFIAACAGGDLAAVVALLDPEVAGEAALLGHGELVRVAGRPAVAHRLLGLFGPGTGMVMLPLSVEDSPGVVALAGGRVVAVMRLDAVNGLIRHIRSHVRPRSATGPR
jgi:RNA polymerase sigma-70 factor (ECF subfamily)